MARFLNNLKQKTMAGSSGPSSEELQQAGQTIFLERSNINDLEELILVQDAHAKQTQNGAGLPHPGISKVVSTSISDSGAATSVLVPANYEIFNIIALTIKNTSGGDAGIQVTVSDGTTSVLLGQGNVSNGTEFPLITPFIVTDTLGGGSASSGMMIDSKLQIFVASDANISANVAYQVLSVA
jgi:hypothetical protein